MVIFTMVFEQCLCGKGRPHVNVTCRFVEVEATQAENDLAAVLRDQAVERLRDQATQDVINGHDMRFYNSADEANAITGALLQRIREKGCG